LIDFAFVRSHVAMNAWLPQASYPCGNFSDTSSVKFLQTKGSIGPVTLVSFDQTSPTIP